MKKFFAIAAVALMALTANAQIYVGGGLGIENGKANEDADAVTSYNFNPEVGYNLSEDLAVGLEFSYGDTGEEGSKATYGLAPYARKTFYKDGQFSIFGQAKLGYYHKGEKNDQIKIAIEPGIRYDLNDKFFLVAKTNLLSYYKNSGDNSGKGSALNLGIDNKVSFGLFYNF